MDALSGIDVFNIVMSIGIVGLLLAIRDINICNRELHERNLQERVRDREMFPECNDV